MCKENKECKCNGKCGGNCKCNKTDPLIIGFENYETGKLERYEFIEEIEFNGEKVMAITLVDGNGKVEFATCKEDSFISDFITDVELEIYFSKLHEEDEQFLTYETIDLVNEEGEEKTYIIIDEFKVNEKQVYVILVNTEDGYITTFIKQQKDDQYYLVIDDEEFCNLSSIYDYILNQNDEN